MEQDQTLKETELAEKEQNAEAASDEVSDATGQPSQEEVAELKDQLLRTLAEFENYKKRADRELQDMAKYAMSNFAKDLLPVADNFARALQSVPQEGLEENALLKGICDGVKMTEAELEKAFKKHHIIKIAPLNEAFDHNFHQAIMEVEDTGKEPGSVVEVLQSGYKIHDRLLRPAMVKVAK